MINKTNSDHYRSPYGIRISTAEADRTPETVSLVGGQSRNRKVPSDHNVIYPHNCWRWEKILQIFSTSICVYLSVYFSVVFLLHIHTYALCWTYSKAHTTKPCLILHTLMHIVHMHFTATHTTFFFARYCMLQFLLYLSVFY